MAAWLVPVQHDEDSSTMFLDTVSIMLPMPLDIIGDVPGDELMPIVKEFEIKAPELRLKMMSRMSRADIVLSRTASADEAPPKVAKKSKVEFGKACGLDVLELIGTAGAISSAKRMHEQTLSDAEPVKKPKLKNKMNEHLLK